MQERYPPSPGRRGRWGRRGAAVVEMALVLPIFFMLVLGIVEFGRAMMVGQLVTNASRHGARIAILEGSTNSSVEQAIHDFMLDAVGVSADDVIVTVEIVPGAGNPDPAGDLSAAQARDLCKVTVEVPYDKVSWIPSKYLAGKTLSGFSAMRHE